jgi:hypothetical protein
MVATPSSEGCEGLIRAIQRRGSTNNPSLHLCQREILVRR